MKKILIVDDTELMLMIEGSFLEREHMEVYTARSGMEALQQAVEVEPDLILMDLNMPDLNGDEVCIKLKNSEMLKGIPIIIVTAEEGDRSFKKCIEAGCDGFLIKPFEKTMFLNKIREHLAVADRKFKRIPVRMPCVFIQETDSVPGMITNMSEGGVFVQARSTPAQGTPVELKFTLPDGSHSIKCKCVVRWQRASDAVAGFGLEFLNLPEKDLKDIARVVAAARV